MDAEQIESTAQHLALLGCTAEQIERHVGPLRSIAAKQPQPTLPKPKPKQPPPLSQEQIQVLLQKLRSRTWRWVTDQPKDDTGDWVGHAILEVTGMPDTKFGATPNALWVLVGRVLTQLTESGLIRK